MLWKLKYLWLVIKNYPVSLFWNPWFVLRLTLTRLLFTVTRRYCGPSLTTPSSDPVFNIQALVNAFAMYVVRELDGPWIKLLRETPAPVILDIGSNIGQFARYAGQFNPGAIIYTFDAWRELAGYNREFSHQVVALGDTDQDWTTLTKSNIGWTASTESGYYRGEEDDVHLQRLDYLVERNDIRCIDLMKIDVDGAEWQVLKGATKALKITRCLLIETNEPEKLPAGFKWTTRNRFDWCGIRE
jgi:FkbM family methyltransferase